MTTPTEDLGADKAKQEDTFFLVPRSESSFVLKATTAESDSNSSIDVQLPVFLRRVSTVSAAEFSKRQSKLKQIFGQRRKRSPQVATMTDSGSQLALFHHLRGNSLIKQVSGVI